jgi:hypothetical protein
MGADSFINHGPGTDPKDIFYDLVSQVAHEHGHGGYTGTIAEKDNFIIVPNQPVRLLDEALLWADKQLGDYESDAFWQDKWGPAAAIPIYIPTLTGAKDPLVRRTVEVKVTVPVDASWEAVEKAAWEQGELRLRAGERVLQVSATDSAVTYSKPKVKARAPSGKAVTRYVVSHSEHSLWEKGFDSQAEARAHAVACAESTAKRILTDKYARVSGAISFNVDSVTRREDGSPLVEVICTVETKTIPRQVTVVKGDVASLTANGWLFFGYASC